MTLHPKYSRYAKKSLLFAVFWSTFAFIYSIIEVGLLGNLEYYPSTNNKYDFMTSLLYTTIGGFLVGWIHGWVEVSWLAKRFQRSPLWLKTVLKTLFYIVFIIIFLIVISFAVNSYSFQSSPFSPEVLESIKSFINNFAFWSVVIYIGTCVLMGMLFAELVWYMGDRVFLNFLLGKYHKPMQETRIFMFLDMKSSTTIAEEMGHVRYFELLSECYADMSNPIMETSGEVYQYVGDEIVVTWPQSLGLYQNNCIECFKRISSVFETRKSHYLDKFGVQPHFKAGFHMGLVTTGEIGILKKDIIYTGDVLNTAARIQGECNTYNTNLLISEQLVNQLASKGFLGFQKVDNLLLRGKTESIQLYAFPDDV